MCIRDSNGTAEHKAQVQAYKHSDAGKAAVYTSNAKRRAWFKNELTGQELGDIKAIYIERDRLNAEAGFIAYHVDHIHPIAKGGAHHPDNLQILSAEENIRKGAKLNLEER